MLVMSRYLNNNMQSRLFDWQKMFWNLSIEEVNKIEKESGQIPINQSTMNTRHVIDMEDESYDANMPVNDDSDTQSTL